MQIGILGSGVTAQTIGSRLVQLGHEVMLGSRDEANPPAVTWANDAGQHALYGTFMNAAAFGEIVFNCTLGSASLDALTQAGAENLQGKILIDTANPLDRSTDVWTLTICNTDSLGEQIQRAFPETKVVKTLNTVNARVMVYPQEVAGGDHHVFISADDPDAKAQVTELLRSFSWINIFDLGDLSTARGTEAYLLLWVRLYGSMNTSMINVKIMK